jgi:2-keto-4-pentenoate hydratase/2-oxohepta-3-ene-1,7-dioic acid hydratase in catechol pathway
MKLMRFGDAGRERPGILDQQGCVRVAGDVILTDTPRGVAYNKSEPDYLRPRELLRRGIEGLGEQRTEVVH